MGGIIALTARWEDDGDELIRLRKTVFVDEQNVPASLESDGRDHECLHAKALIDDIIIGTGRLLPDGYIGRMCVLGKYRNRGVGTAILKNLVQQAADSGHDIVSLNSQSSAIPFYQKFGFTSDSDEFIEAGIPHRRMILNIKTKN